MGKKCRQTDVKLTNVECSNYASLTILSLVLQNIIEFSKSGPVSLPLFDRFLTDIACHDEVYT